MKDDELIDSFNKKIDEIERERREKEESIEQEKESRIKEILECFDMERFEDIVKKNRKNAEEAVMNYLYRFGYADSHELERFVFDYDSKKNVGRMSRILKPLEVKKLIIRKKQDFYYYTGKTIFLTSRGHDFASYTHFLRNLNNERLPFVRQTRNAMAFHEKAVRRAALVFQRAGFYVMSDRESKKWAGISNGKKKMLVPDLVICIGRPTHKDAFFWGVEVEVARKSKAGYLNKMKGYKINHERNGSKLRGVFFILRDMKIQGEITRSTKNLCFMAEMNDEHIPKLLFRSIEDFEGEKIADLARKFFEREVSGNASRLIKAAEDQTRLQVDRNDEYYEKEIEKLRAQIEEIKAKISYKIGSFFNNRSG